MSASFNANFPNDEARRAYYRDAQRRWKANPENREKARKRCLMWHQYHKEQQALYRNSYRERTMTPERESAYHRKSHYGLKPVAFEAMLLAQCGKCGICGNVMTNPYVDHDHETGEVRGLLCVRCNAALGTFGDNTEGVLRVLDYLVA